MVKHFTCARSQITLYLFVAIKTSQQAKRQYTCRGHKSVKQVTEATETSEDEITDSEDPLFKIEEVSNVKTSGKQLNARIIFSDPKELFNTELECQLDTGATCNVMRLRDLAILNQTRE